MMMKMNKKRKKSGMSMDKGMKFAKSTKKGMAGDDMYEMDSMPVKKAMGGMMRPPPPMTNVKPAAPTSMPPSGRGAMPSKPAPTSMPPSGRGAMPSKPAPTSMPPGRGAMPNIKPQVNVQQPMMKAKGGAVNAHKKMAMGYADGGMVQSRGNGAARGKKTRIC